MIKSIRTMEQFAAFVGLSRPTVSKYFNNPRAVRESTRRRIEVALEECGFQPNLLAVNLKRRQSKIVGIVVPSIRAPFFAALTRRISQLLSERGYLGFVLSSEGQHALEEQAIRTCAAMNVAGVLLAPLGVRQQRSRLHDVNQDMPLVAMDSPLDNITEFVGTDNHQSIEMLVDYLCATGSAPTYLGAPMVNANSWERQQAYINSMERRGLQPQVVALPDTHGWEFEQFAYEETLRILAGEGFATDTLLCANDRLAIGVIAAAYTRGLSVGRQGAALRVCGHDNHPHSAYTCPALTTAAQNVDDIGRLATELLFARLGLVESPLSADHTDVRVEASLVVRLSA